MNRIAKRRINESMEIKVSAKDSEIFDVASFRMSSQNSRIWRGRLMMNLLAVMDESMVSLILFDILS